MCHCVEVKQVCWQSLTNVVNFVGIKSSKKNSKRQSADLYIWFLLSAHHFNVVTDTLTNLSEIDTVFPNFSKPSIICTLIKTEKHPFVAPLLLC